MATFVGRRLQYERQRQGLSSSRFAEILGIEESYLRSLEAGEVIPSLFATRVIAQALQLPVESLFHRDPDAWLPSSRERYYSVFISYGGPDEPYARACYSALDHAGVRTFFFPESAVPGQRLHRTMNQGVNEYDRILLICSKSSLVRKGVLNELEQVLAREAREGATELLVPITIDDYVFSEWSPQRPDLATQVRDRVIADFRGAPPQSELFRVRFAQVLNALEIPR